MTDQEFDLLDELYFLSGFEELSLKLEIEELILKNQLAEIFKKGWLKILEKGTEGEVDNLDLFDKNYKNYNYLASKAGLLAHNSM
jgi:hypothetical protein